MHKECLSLASQKLEAIFHVMMEHSLFMFLTKKYKNETQIKGVLETCLLIQMVYMTI